MVFNPDNPHRRSLRLQGYDYSRPGAYFVTLCTCHRQCLFGEIQEGNMRLNEFGKVVYEEWRRSAEIRTHQCITRHARFSPVAAQLP